MLDKKGNTRIAMPVVLLAHGSFDTKIRSEDRQYEGITLKEIADMVLNPQSTEKADAAFIIPSSYRAFDGRKHSAQREHGLFHYLALDIDEGSPSLVDLKDAVKRTTADATALIYSSSGASDDNRKWRVLIPLLEPISGADYGDTQLAFFHLMSEQGITCDAALARVGQPIFLPNVPPAKRDEFGQPLFYHQDLHRGDGYLDVKNSSTGVRCNSAVNVGLSQSVRLRRIVLPVGIHSYDTRWRGFSRIFKTSSKRSSSTAIDWVFYV